MGERSFRNAPPLQKGPGEGLWHPQLPQTFPDHKNGPMLISQSPGNHVKEVEGTRPGTSQFLGPVEQDPAHVELVVRLGDSGAWAPGSQV